MTPSDTGSRDNEGYYIWPLIGGDYEGSDYFMGRMDESSSTGNAMGSNNATDYTGAGGGTGNELKTGGDNETIIFD